MKENLLGTIIWSIATFYYHKNDENNEFSYFKNKNWGINMLNIQDVSHLSKRSKKHITVFVESVRKR